MEYGQWLDWFATFDAWSKKSNIMLPILLSIIAAVIFWFVFSFIPEKKRRTKLRPIVELTIFDAYKKLFSLFDLAMRHSLTCPSFYQLKIRAGNLSKDNIKLGLQNKCLNQSFLYDPHISNALLIVGDKILEHSKNIDELCNKALTFHTYTAAKELILLEKIREKIRAYHFDERQVNKPCRIVINGQVFHPTDLSISYRSQNLYELYQLFCILQKIALGQTPLDRERYIYKMQWLYHSGQYHACAKFIRSQKNRFRTDLIISNNYLALSEHKKGKPNEFYKIIEDTYKSRPNEGLLIGSRTIFQEFINDNKLINTLSRFYSSDELDALREAIKEDKEQKEIFETSNQLLEDYYKNNK